MATQKIRTGDVQVSGLRELNKALKDLPGELQKELPEINREVARLVVDDARSKALSIGGVAAKTAPSIGVLGGARSAGVGFGGARAPWAGGAEFGAGRDVRRTRSTGSYLGFNQFKSWRGNGPKAGYFVYPSIRQNNDRIVQTYEERLNDLLERAFPD